jgi:hypothetical protein
MLAQLARQLQAAALRSGRRSPASLERTFESIMRDPDMRVAIETLTRDVRRSPDVEHMVTVRAREPAVRLTQNDPSSVFVAPLTSPGGRAVAAAHNHPAETGRIELLLNRFNDEAPLSGSDISMAVNYDGAGGRGFKSTAALVSDATGLRSTGTAARITERARRHLTRGKLREPLLALQGHAAKNTALGVNANMESINRALNRLGLIQYGARYGPAAKNAFAQRAREMNLMEDALLLSLHPRVFGLPYPFRWSQIGGGAALGAGVAGGAALGARNRRRRRK